MRYGTPEPIDQARTATDALLETFADALLAVYLHGSAVSGGLRPHSDIDLLAVVDRAVTEAERKTLLSALLRISTPHPAPPGQARCVEVLVFSTADLAALDFPARSEFIYGEWRRDAFEAGELPMPKFDPENTLVLAQARQRARALSGPDVARLLPEVPPAHIRRAMRDLLPVLLDDLGGDERNVLLTLARMWRTAATAEFVSKDAAAAWAAVRMPNREARALIAAREAYLGNVEDYGGEDGSEGPSMAARRAAAYLHERVSECLGSAE